MFQEATIYFLKHWYTIHFLFLTYDNFNIPILTNSFKIQISHINATHENQIYSFKIDHFYPSFNNFTSSFVKLPSFEFSPLKYQDLYYLGLSFQIIDILVKTETLIEPEPLSSLWYSIQLRNSFYNTLLIHKWFKMEIMKPKKTFIII